MDILTAEEFGHTKINRATVLIAARHRNGKDHIVLLDRHVGSERGERYVTAYWAPVMGEQEWGLGHYFRLNTEALADFNARLAAINEPNWTGEA